MQVNSFMIDISHYQEKINNVMNGVEEKNLYKSMEKYAAKSSGNTGGE